MNRMDDLISRAEAIELKPEFLNPNVNRETKEQTAIDRAYARGWNSCNTHWIKEIIEDLPSAQPEIIRCKDCKYITEHYDTDGNVPYWTCSEWDSGTDYDGFCHYAERRTDDSISD